ncbi:metalloregulator ArsR/SmtB family transcription factor [Streptomyces sp. NPDC047880]|uniref:ArsR/SmtB family transcription factor n=1 Tax=Streptomyces sp. NPDC047880 TaxID=3155626 RepID=UPI00345721B8
MSNQDMVVLSQGDGVGDTPGSCCPALLTTPLDEGQAPELAKVFKALGDPVRLRLLSMIASRAGGEVCVCDLTPAFDLSQPTISHHLKLLRQAGLIDCERRGTWVYYRLVPEMTDRLAAILTRPSGDPLPDRTAPAVAAS